MESTSKATEVASSHANIVPTTITSGSYQSNPDSYLIDAKNVGSNCPFQYTTIDFGGESFWVNRIAFEYPPMSTDQYPDGFMLYYCWDCVPDGTGEPPGGSVPYLGGI